MLKTLLKIAFRNFSMRFKTTLVLILGICVPSMLLVGGLSLNDSISRFMEKSFSTNFGAADAYVENRRNNIFFKLPFDQEILDELKNEEEISAILPVGETLGRIEFNGRLKDCLVIMVDPKSLSEFVGKFVDLSKGILVSKDLAQVMNISEGQLIDLNVGSGGKQLRVHQIGKEGFLNFRGENLHYAGTIFVDKDQFQGMFPFPTRVYLSLKLPIEQQESFVETLESKFKVNAVAMKARLLNSPASKALGYLTIAFSSFSIVASLVLVYIFAQSFIEERNPIIVTMRILGMKTKHISSTLMIEGTVYMFVAGCLGSSVGTFLGKYLLNRLQSFTTILTDNFASIFSQLEFHVSPSTILIGVFAGLVLPLFLFSLRVMSLTRKPPIQTFTKRSQGTLRISSSIKVLSFLLGLSVIVLLTFVPTAQPITAWKLLLRGVGFFLASWLICLPVLSFIRKVLSRFSHKKSVSIFLALSYVERNLRSASVVAVMFGLIVFVMIIVITIPYNVERLIEDKFKTGLFGYNFMVIYNPLKLVFLKEEIDITKDLNEPARVYIAQFEDDLIAFVDENFLKTATVPIETNKKWRERLLHPNTIVLGYTNEEKKNLTKTIIGTIRSPFRIGGSEKMSFEVIDTFDMRKLMVPVKYIASINSLPKNVRLIPIVLGEVEPQAVSKVKEFYSKRFDFPVHITEELNRLFSGVDLLVRVGVTLLYFGLMSGFSGIAFYTLRNITVRKRLTGALRAIGMTSKGVANAFILESLTIASVGVVVGLLAGFLESKDVTKTILVMFGSEHFVFPIWRFFSMVSAIYVVVILVIFLAVKFFRASLAESLRTPELGGTL
ncbi:FtsX-like permease family protein [Pseudothermotoga sp.]|uniref:FtsX-like permease family protein n=1 Tax=Pseudothermotoga sp. TaxID=2033661 RepID=UPI0031F5F1D0